MRRKQKKKIPDVRFEYLFQFHTDNTTNTMHDQIADNHEFNETCHSVTSYFMSELIF